ncbi:ketose-bisphosphate aldolase [Clostridium sp. MCC353]|uniref:class II fructose-bisphosphate aldolase n=1 Tax=Clostridium sp. MCC353 TaxID=2592646 RepID=UPI001C036922|nr:class II fructose-bisphosphate aldolase [Clostridium sp. MCC353]MBT9775228.1 ketose-bisphosphate aldolase [Clostridium sp. MCC353]
MGLKAPKELYQDAVRHNYGLGAFNTFSIEGILAVLEACKEQRSPAIIQISMGARNYVKHLKSYVDVIKCMAGNYDIPVFIQHDHCSTVEACKEAIDAGVQAVMFDGSHLPFEENAAKTREVVAYAHERDVWVEAELGCLPGFEDLVFAEKAVFTDPEMARRFISETGCDALAVAVGTSHGGVAGDDYLPLDFDLLERIISQKPDYPYVLHGAASLPPELIAACNDQGGKVEYLRNCCEESIAKAVKMGVRKVNMDVDNFLVFTTAVRKFLNEKPDIYDPRKYLGPGTKAFQKEVEHKIKEVLDSANRY